MPKSIFVLITIAGVLAVSSCHKEQPCTDLSAYYQNTYVMRDSIVYGHDSIVIVPFDTITFNPISNSGGKYFINYINPGGEALLAEGCADNFKVDTADEGLYIYYGKGSITNDGGNISLTFQCVPAVFAGDTLQYYCSGAKQ